jgi:hypothetical protein
MEVSVQPGTVWVLVYEGPATHTDSNGQAVHMGYHVMPLYTHTPRYLWTPCTVPCMGVIAFYGTTGEGVQPVLEWAIEGYWRRPVHGVYSVVTCKGPYPVLPWMPQTRQARV